MDFESLLGESSTELLDGETIGVVSMAHWASYNSLVLSKRSFAELHCAECKTVAFATADS